MSKGRGTLKVAWWSIIPCLAICNKKGEKSGYRKRSELSREIRDYKERTYRIQFSCIICVKKAADFVDST